jgi:hypothetical protein
VKADLITCPESKDLGSFFSRLICSSGNWFLGHALGLVLLIIIIAVIYFYWYSRSDKTRSKVSMYGKIVLLIILLMIFFPAIKSLLFTNPFEPSLTIQNYYDPNKNLLADSPYYFIRNGRSSQNYIEVKNTGATTYGRVSCTYRDPDNILQTNSSECEQIESGQTKNYTVYMFMDKPFPDYGGEYFWNIINCKAQSSINADCSGYVSKEFAGMNPDRIIWNVHVCDDPYISAWCDLNTISPNYTWSNYGNDAYGNDSYWMAYCNVYGNFHNMTITIKPLLPDTYVNMSVDFSYESPPANKECTVSAVYPNEASCDQICYIYAFANVTAEYGTLYDITITNGESDYYP